MSENFFADGLRAKAAGQANRFQQAAAAAYAAPDAAARTAALQQAANEDVDGAMTLDKTFQAQDDSVAAKAAGAARYVLNAVKTGDPRAAEGAYQAVRPFLTKIGAAQGKVPPPNWTPEMEPMLHQVIAASQGAGAGTVQSTYIDDTGNRVAIMRDGSQKTLGGNVNNLKTTKVPLPDGREGTVTFDPISGGYKIAVIEGAGGATGGAPATGPVSFTGADGTPVAIDPGLPPNVQAEIRAREGAAAAAPAGIPAIGMTPAQIEAAKAQGKAQVELATAGDIEAAKARGKTAAELSFADQQAAAAGSKAAAEANAKADAENAQAASGKMPQINAVQRGISRIDDALKALDHSTLSTGPVEQYATRYTQAGQELSAAVQGMQSSLLALTRVPGMGSQSDLEAKVAAAQYPQLGVDPAVNRRTLAALKALSDDIQSQMRQRVAAAHGSGPQNTNQVVSPRPSNAPPRRARNPQTGEVVELRNGQWVPVR